MVPHRHEARSHCFPGGVRRVCLLVWGPHPHEARLVANPARERRLNMWGAIFWASHVPIGIVAYVLLPRDVFMAIALLYTVIASQWANIASHWAAAIAARAEEKLEDR